MNSSQTKNENSYGHFFVYALLDENDKPFYIGRTKRPNSRILQHLSEAEQYENSRSFSALELLGLVFQEKPDVSNKAKLNKINAIKKNGAEVKIKILDEWECDDIADANRLEDAWIAEIRRQGHKLTNKILSHRMNPAWYNADRKGWKPGYYTNPTEYIAWLKSDAYKKKKDEYNENRLEWSNKRYRNKQRYYSKKSKKETKKKTPFFRSKR